jgi:hypothetical protein
VPIHAQEMVGLAVGQDDSLTPGQLAELADSQFSATVLPRIAELDSAAAAGLVAGLRPWEAARLAELHTTPVELLTALAQHGPYVAGVVVGDPRVTAEILAAIGAHHDDPAGGCRWPPPSSPDVDVTLMAVPLLARTPEPRARMIGYLDGHLGASAPQRQTADRLLRDFPGTLAELLLFVASIHQRAAD